MSRVIKFRLHCAGTGKVLAYECFNTTLNWGYYWVDATLPEDERICKTLDYFKHPEPLGVVKRVQFTGLHDLNGVEIYEGDIVKCAFHRLYEVRFDGKNYSCRFKKIDGNSCKGLDELSAIVLGNIYEHPHLIDGGK